MKTRIALIVRWNGYKLCHRSERQSVYRKQLLCGKRVVASLVKTVIHNTDHPAPILDVGTYFHLMIGDQRGARIYNSEAKALRALSAHTVLL